MYTNFEWGARAEKTQLFGRNFQKMPKNAYFDMFIFDMRRRKTVFLVICESLENQFDLVNLKKRSAKFRKFYENPAPRKNPRSAPPTKSK